MNVKRKYKLNKSVTENKLLNNGFSINHTYQCFVYKDLIKLVLNIDIDEKWWNYKIIDISTNELYSPYYNREFGNSDVVELIDIKLEQILKGMVRNKILYRHLGNTQKIYTIYGIYKRIRILYIVSETE